MKKVLLLAKDISYAKKVSSVIDRNRYILMEGDNTNQNVFSFCLNSGADVVLVHSSFLGNYTLLDQLLFTKRFQIIFLSSKNETGFLYSIMNNPRFYLINDLKYYCINEIMDLMIRDTELISSLEMEKDKYKESIEEEKWIKKAKLLLLKKGYAEAEAYKYILKKSMDERITKKNAAKKIIEEEGF